MNGRTNASSFPYPNHAIEQFKIKVLLIDDQQIVYEAVKKMLNDQYDIMLTYCSDPIQALPLALELKPTVILQDLVMPECDGLMLVKYFRAHTNTREIPIIVLSSKEEAQTKADAFANGANDYIVKLPSPIELVARIRYHSNSYIRLLERNEAYKRLDESQHLLLGELAEAAEYVRSLIPAPMNHQIQTDWRFIPSALLGGDALGYRWIDDRYFAFYLLDVCGHGVGAALLSISVINLLGSQSLPNADFHDPSSVLKALNDNFQMERHNNMFFTIWYGVFDLQTKQIIYANGGHPPPLLMTGKNKESAKMIELKSDGIAIGAFLDSKFMNQTQQLDDFNYLLIFSDGVFEIEQADGKMIEFHQFTQLVKEMFSRPNFSLDEIVQAMQRQQRKNEFVDDFSLLGISFKKD
jgi:phosphoserine phosphatase RsbU/P